MLESRQVPRGFHKCHTRVSSTTLGSDAEITGSGDTPQSALNILLRTPGGGDWRITKDTRQGDFGCDIFLGVYDIPLKKYVNSRQPTNEVMKLEDQNVDVSLLTFVDDLIDTLIKSTSCSMKMRDTANDKRHTQELRKVGCELEPSKEESLLRWMGPNAKKNLAKCRTRNLLGPGRFPQAVRHLGCWLEVDGDASTMIRQRIIAMRTSFYRYVGLWKSRHVSTRIKRMIFQAGINGAAISGYETYVFSTAQWKQLESERMILLRRAFAGEGYNYITLRRKLRFPTLESITRKRRLRWYQSILTRPSHHSIYLTTLFGSCDWEKIADFELHDSLTHHALSAR